MVIETLKPVLYKCVRCGALTEWDPELCPNPLCVKHWDMASDKYIREIFSAGQRAYRERNKEKALITS